MVKLKLQIPKLNYNFPSVSEMTEFGKRYGKDWEYLTRDKDFRDLVLIDLELAEIRAKEILGIK